MLFAAGMAVELTSEREDAILRRCQAGDWSEYCLIVERYKRLVWAAIDAGTSDKDAVPDLVQEVFIRAFEKLHTFRYRASFSSWLYRIARNHALNHTRKLKRRSQAVVSDMPDNTQDAMASIPGSERPEKHYDKAARQAALEDMLENLPEHYRAVLNMYYLGEMSYQEMADALNIPVNTVRTHLRRARLRMMELSEARGWK